MSDLADKVREHLNAGAQQEADRIVSDADPRDVLLDYLLAVFGGVRAVADSAIAAIQALRNPGPPADPDTDPAECKHPRAIRLNTMGSGLPQVLCPDCGLGDVPGPS